MINKLAYTKDIGKQEGATTRVKGRRGTPCRKKKGGTSHSPAVRGIMEPIIWRTYCLGIKKGAYADSDICKIRNSKL